MSPWVSHVEQRALGEDHLLVTIHLTAAGEGASLATKPEGAGLALVQFSEYPPNIGGISDDTYADLGFDPPSGHHAIMRNVARKKITILFERSLDLSEDGA